MKIKYFVNIHNDPLEDENSILERLERGVLAPIGQYEVVVVPALIAQQRILSFHNAYTDVKLTPKIDFLTNSNSNEKNFRLLSKFCPKSPQRPPKENRFTISEPVVKRPKPDMPLVNSFFERKKVQTVLDSVHFQIEQFQRVHYSNLLLVSWYGRMNHVHYRCYIEFYELFVAFLMDIKANQSIIDKALYNLEKAKML